MAQFRGLKGQDGTDVPKMLLAGGKVLKDKSVPLPKDTIFREAFEEHVGTSLAPGTPQREQAYLAFKSLYAGTDAAQGLAYGEGEDLDGDDRKSVVWGKGV